MTARLRLVLLEARPAVVFLLGLSGAVGLALSGQANDPVSVARLLVLVTAFVVYAVSCNDLADLEIDRVNLPDDDRRPLVTGTAAARDVRLMAAGAAVVTASAAATQGLAALLLTLAGLAVAAAYSLPPFRLSRRGVVAPLVLPALFVGVPFVLGVLAGRGLRLGDVVLLAALYVGFIGRIVLKDFRDVVGDRLFGKRTFLVRHGRGPTCVLSAVCWVAGTAALIVVTPGTTWWYAGCQAILAASCHRSGRPARGDRDPSHRGADRLLARDRRPGVGGRRVPRGRERFAGGRGVCRRRDDRTQPVARGRDDAARAASAAGDGDRPEADVECRRECIDRLLQLSLAGLARPGEGRDRQRLAAPRALDPPVAADPAVHEHRREHVAVVLVPQPVVVGGVDEAVACLGVVAAEHRVELGEQADSGKVAGGRCVGQVGVGETARTVAPDEVEAIEESVDLAQPEAGPPGDVAPGARAVRREVEPDRLEHRVVAPHAVGRAAAER